MLLVKTQLDAAQDGRVGVFALEPIQKGEAVLEDNPIAQIIFSEDDLKKYPASLANFIKEKGWPSSVNQHDYILTIDNEVYINQSNEPNIDSDGYAVKDIFLGDELTVSHRSSTL